MRAWFQEAGLVNTIVDCTGQSCCAESANPALRDEKGRDTQGRLASISIFVATGSRRMVMRDAVQENYAAVAESGSSCGCSVPAGEAAVISRECE
jgi:arsenite methyltransferase